ncbi:sodium:solute symporter family transporter [Pseudomonas aeruginosa]
MSVNTPTLITFVIYIAAMVLIGLAAYRSTNNFSDYILGGRSLGSFVTALSAGASDMSGWLLMGLPGAVYLSGLSESWIAIGLIVGAYLNWLFVAGRLRVQTEHNGNALTLPDYFTNRFEDNSRLLRIFSALVILVFFTIYCASGIVAGARLFESTFGLSYETALWAGAAATIAYTFIGGFLAVSWTDTVQASLMIFALILTPVIVMLATGGVEPTFTAIELKDATSFDMLKGASFIGVISLMAWGLGYFGQPHILARFMAADSVIALESGLVEPRTAGEVLVDVPAGQVRARYRMEGGKVGSVRFTNVPSFLLLRDLTVQLPALGELRLDIAYGGNFYPIIEPQPNYPGCEHFSPQQLLEWGREVQRRINREFTVVHPQDPSIRGVRHCMWTGRPLAADSDGRSVVIAGDSLVDRSPCGTGTSARVAQRHARGLLAPGEVFRHESLIGSRFDARVESATELADGTPAVYPNIEGRAFITSHSEHHVDRSHPYWNGFSLEDFSGTAHHDENLK